MRSVLEALGFKQKSHGSRPNGYYDYAYDFGNLHLTAIQCENCWFVPVFSFGGVFGDGRSIFLVDFETPIEVESFEQGIAWIAHGVGAHFCPVIPTAWLECGRLRQDLLPWRKRQKEFEARPYCLVEKDWFRVAAKKLRAATLSATGGDLAWLTFDGKALRITACGLSVIMPATGKAWDDRYAIKAARLDHLPKRLKDGVQVNVWDGRLTLGNMAWVLAQTQEKNEREEPA